MRPAVLDAALAAAAMAAPAGAATVTGTFAGFAADYRLPLDEHPVFTRPVSASVALNDSRTTLANGGVTEVRAATRGDVVNGRPELGFSIASGPISGGRGEAAASAGVAVGFFDGLLLATPVEPRDLPSSLVFNLVTTVSGSTAGPGQAGVASIFAADADRLDRALADARNTPNISRSTTLTPSSLATTLTLAVTPANAPGLRENLRTGTLLTEQELKRRRREALARVNASIRDRLATAALPGRGASCIQDVGKADIWEPLAVGAVGLGVAFGGLINDRVTIATRSETDAFNNLTLDGICITDPDTGAPIRFWIAGFSGLDHIPDAFRPAGEEPFAPNGPAVIPLPAAGWLHLGVLASLPGLGRLRRRA